MNFDTAVLVTVKDVFIGGDSMSVIFNEILPTDTDIIYVIKNNVFYVTKTCVADNLLQDKAIVFRKGVVGRTHVTQEYNTYVRCRKINGIIES